MILSLGETAYLIFLCFLLSVFGYIYNLYLVQVRTHSVSHNPPPTHIIKQQTKSVPSLIPEPHHLLYCQQTQQILLHFVTLLDVKILVFIWILLSLKITMNLESGVLHPSLVTWINPVARGPGLQQCCRPSGFALQLQGCWSLPLLPWRVAQGLCGRKGRAFITVILLLFMATLSLCWFASERLNMIDWHLESKFSP